MPKGLAILVTGIALSVAVIFLWVLSSQNPGFESTYMLLMLITIVLGIPGRKILTGETPWWSPHAFVLASLFIYFVLGSTASVHYRLPSMASNRPLYAEELNAGMMVVLLSTVSYLLGFRFGPKPAMFPARIEWFFADTPSVQVRFNMVTMTLFIVGVLAWVVTFASVGGVGSHLQNLGDRQETVGRAGGIVLHLSRWAYVGFFLYFARNGVRPMTIAMFGLLMVIYLIFGSRNWVAMFVAGTAVIYRMRFGKIPNVVWPAMAGGLVFMQVFLVLLRAASGNVDQAQFMLSRSLRTTRGTLLSFLGDFTFIRYLSDLTVSMGSVVPYQWGKTILSFFYVIPSILWNPREYLATGPDVYMRYLTPEQIRFVSIGPTLLGEFIMNFGWPGVILLPIVLGMILSWFQSATISHPHRRYQLAFPVLAGVFGPEMISFVKIGFQDSAIFPYLLLPLVIPYLPNLTYLTSGPPKVAPAPT